MSRPLSEDAVRLQAIEESKDKSIVKMCSNCVKFDRANSRCLNVNKHTESYMFCPAHEFEIDRIVKVAMNDLKRQQTEADKIENLLALAITTANTTTCFLEDLESRIKKVYNSECSKENRKLLRRDIDMSSTMKKAFKDIESLMEKISQRYRFYVEPYIMKWFSSEGKFNAHQADGHLNNSMEFGRLLMLFTMKCIGNKKNCDAVFNLLGSMQNDFNYALTEKDAEHYKLRGFDE